MSLMNVTRAEYHEPMYAIPAAVLVSSVPIAFKSKDANLANSV